MQMQKRLLRELLSIVLPLSAAREVTLQYGRVHPKQLRKRALVATLISRHQFCISIAHASTLIRTRCLRV
jgi:hypothetical protein